MKNYKFKTKQNGVVLAIGIILLLIISMLGLNSMKSAILQQKMVVGLDNHSMADNAAYSLNVAVENYVLDLFISNNGTSDFQCEYCLDEKLMKYQFPAIGTYRAFMVKAMGTDSARSYPGSTNVISAISDELHDDPEFILYQLTDGIGGTDNNGNNFGATNGEEGGGNAGSSGGGANNGPDLLVANTYLIATKANDRTGNIYVVNESVVSGILN